MIGKDQINRSLSFFVKKIRKSFSWKDFLVFLFFLLVSSALWFMRTLRNDFDTDVKVPLHYVNQPKGYVQVLELPEYITVRVSDRGTSIIGLILGKKLTPIEVDLREYVHKRTLVTSGLADDVLKRLNSTSVIRGFYPDSIHLQMLKLEEKVLPVKFTGTLELERQYMQCDTIEITPHEVTVYAPRAVLDTIQFALTQQVELKKVKDTLSTTLHLQDLPGVSYSTNEVELKVRTEQYTEKTLEVPIYVENLPDGLNLILFPSSVELSFFVGISVYDKVDASSFSLSVDYQDVALNNKYLKVKVDYSPKGTFNLDMKQSEVGFLVETTQ